MKVSENWLREWVDVPAWRELLVERLTMSGLEVESMQVLGEGLDGIVVGAIESAEPHPNADRLRVCRVRIGTGEPVVVVCGAPNARVGLRAPLATVGTRLPNGVEIRRAALRGVESDGMLCSGRELGLDDDASGLLELPTDAPVGRPLARYLGLPDATLELKLTPNRPDCLGLRGLAAEVATLFDAKVKPPHLEPVPPRSTSTRAIRLAAAPDCPRYLGRVIEGIEPGAPTPLWMVERLRRAGLRSIGAVVDCTNYVMLELGQPMHAFDLAMLDGAIDVRRARRGEKLTLLDAREVVLDEQFLVIADQRRALAVAGVMGGHESRVTAATRDVFLESAHFAPAAIVGRARKLGLHTDASHRFERGVDPELPRLAIERLSALLLEVVGGTPGPVVEAVAPEHLPQRRPVLLRRERLARVLGLTIDDARVEAILRGLGLELQRDPAGWVATPPSRRFDLAIEEDLIEEVIRVHGYDAVPTNLPGGHLPRAHEPEGRVAEGELRRVLCAAGYAEAINFAFVPPDWLHAWSMAEGTVTLANPLSAELSVMRPSLLPGLVEAYKRNRARQQARVRLFEIGHVFCAGDGAPREHARLAALAGGHAEARQWGRRHRPVDFFDLKGDLERMLGLVGAPGEFTFRAALRPYLHPGRSAELLRCGKVVGAIGMLHPALAGTLDLAEDVFALEVELEPVVGRPIPRAGELSPFPSIHRDLSFEIATTVPYAAIERAVREAAGAALKQVVLFDEYAGQGLTDGLRSLAMGLILQDDSRTLTDSDAEQSVGAVVERLATEFGARLRS